MYFDSSIPQGYGVGSSGALVAAIYDRYAQDKITVLENLTREKLLQLKIYSLKWKLFSRKSSGLDPLNSYLSIPILINSKIILKLQVFQIKLWTETLCVRFRNCWRNPMVTIFMENLKDKGFRAMLKSVCKIYRCLCESFLGGDESIVYEY
jgi:mevalonate kinase